MKFKDRTINELAEMICGNTDFTKGIEIFKYRSSYYLTRFFQDSDTDYTHDSKTTRSIWVSDALKEIVQGPQPSGNVPPDSFARVIRTLMDQGGVPSENGQQRTLRLA